MAAVILAAIALANSGIALVFVILAGRNIRIVQGLLKPPSPWQPNTHHGDISVPSSGIPDATSELRESWAEHKRQTGGE